DLVAGLAGLDRETPPKVPDGSLAALAVLAQEVASPLRRASPAEVVPLHVPRTHTLAAHGGDLQPVRPEDQVDPELLRTHPRVDRVVDQLQEGIDARAVVGEERRRDLGGQSLPDGDSISRHPRSQTISETPAPSQ